jgi:hypothetical protein
VLLEQLELYKLAVTAEQVHPHLLLVRQLHAQAAAADQAAHRALVVQAAAVLALMVELAQQVQQILALAAVQVIQAAQAVQV